ncbi:MAG: phospholipid carrier-dependent glycosyltransferase, partial [Candidatus Omnitrophica bacterium]|nr:phospholipid carrier-dependent glycosyltransferase [Candidatus Omnitrophota bacterium]
LGILSLVFLSFSLLHIFYSRSALPESFFTFLTLLSFFISSVAIKGKRGNSSYFMFFIAGILLGCAFLSNRFRIFLFLFFIPWMLFRDKQPHQRHLVLIFLCAFFAVIGIYGACVPQISEYLGISLEPFWPHLQKNILWHAEKHFELLSLFTFPFYIFRFEGPAALFIFVSAIFFTRAKYPTNPFFTFVLLQFIIGSFIDEKPLRAMSPVLPFLAIISAAVFANLFSSLNNRFFQRTIWTFLFLVIIISVLNALPIVTFHTDHPKAVKWIQSDQNYDGPILSTSKSLTKSYAPYTRIAQLDARIKGYYSQGYQYMILDPGMILLGNYTGFWKKDTNRPTYSAILDYCQPIKSFPNYSTFLLELMLYEYTRPSFSQMHAFVQNLPPDAGRIYIYQTGPCIRNIEQHTK